MNDILANIMDVNTVKVNKNVVDGAAPELLKHMPKFLDEVFKGSIRSLNKNIDLQYIGYRLVPPKEELDKYIMNKNSAVMYDISKNDLYLIELKFLYMGEKLTRYLYLPYADRGNLIKLSDVYYHIVPVLSDSVISPDHKQIFVRLLMAKLTFKSVVKNFIVNGMKVPGEVIHSEILRVNAAQITDNIGKPLVPISTYIAAKYGFINGLKHYGKVKDVKVYIKEDKTLEKDYDIYESFKQKPRSLKRTYYEPNMIKIAVKKGNYDKTYVSNYIYDIIYLLDLFPESADEVVSYINNGEIDNEKQLWMLMIGRVSYKNSFSVERMYSDVVEHFDALEGYIDSFTKSKFSNEYSMINNFFDLLYIILKNYTKLISNSKEFNSSIENRYIDIMYYLAYDIIIGFNKSILTINKRYNKKPLSYKEISKIIGDELSTRLVFKLTKSSAMNLAINLAESTGSVIYPKVTSLLADQSTGNGVRKGTKNAFPAPLRTLRADHLVVGTMLFLGKQAPSPAFKINMFLYYDIYSGRINVKNKLKPVVKKIDALLTGRTDNKHIEGAIIEDADIEMTVNID